MPVASLSDEEEEEENDDVDGGAAGTDGNVDGNPDGFGVVDLEKAQEQEEVAKEDDYEVVVDKKAAEAKKAAEDEAGDLEDALNNFNSLSEEVAKLVDEEEKAKHVNVIRMPDVINKL